MKVRRSLLKDAVTVEAYSGQGAYGPEYAAAVEVPCAIDQRRRLVRDVQNAEVVSEETLVIHPEDAASFPPESRLTIAGREATVISTVLFTMRGRTTHCEVNCR